ncbi:MAG: protein translocase subunit SecF [Rickettsiales bacterium]|jgi:preprotein translocase subunit SecF|nr:protein translocase subunit SecF [Rickettsiales bacterium]
MFNQYTNKQYKFNFTKLFPKAKLISIILIIITIISLVSTGLNKGIDFSGGILMEIRFDKTVILNDIRKTFEQNNIEEISIQNFGSDKDIILRLKNYNNGEVASSVVERIKSIINIYDSNYTMRRSEFVGPTISSELLQKGIMALLISFAAILLYITLRFNFSFGLGAVIALIHDIILSFGFYSIFQIEFNLTSIAALLTIIGYSINDSVVIFDRIRENMRKYKSLAIEEILNRSINENLVRTILTSATTLLALISLAVLGGSVLKSFSLGVLFGVVIGTYSSVFIASPILQNSNKARFT